MLKETAKYLALLPIPICTIIIAFAFFGSPVGFGFIAVWPFTFIGTGLIIVTSATLIIRLLRKIDNFLNKTSETTQSLFYIFLIVCASTGIYLPLDNYFDWRNDYKPLAVARTDHYNGFRNTYNRRIENRFYKCELGSEGGGITFNLKHCLSQIYKNPSDPGAIHSRDDL